VQPVSGSATFLAAPGDMQPLRRRLQAFIIDAVSTACAVIRMQSVG
jgi:hypothetical protein